MGQGHQPIGPAHGNYDQLRSSADCCARVCIPTEPDPLLPVACATCDAQPFHNDRVPGAMGKDQDLGENRRYCQVLQHMGQDLK